MISVGLYFIMLAPQELLVSGTLVGFYARLMVNYRHRKTWMRSGGCYDQQKLNLGNYLWSIMMKNHQVHWKQGNLLSISTGKLLL